MKKYITIKAEDFEEMEARLKAFEDNTAFYKREILGATVYYVFNKETVNKLIHQDLDFYKRQAEISKKRKYWFLPSFK